VDFGLGPELKIALPSLYEFVGPKS